MSLCHIFTAWPFDSSAVTRIVTNQRCILCVFLDIFSFSLELYGLYSSRTKDGIRKDYRKRGVWRFYKEKGYTTVRRPTKTHQGKPLCNTEGLVIQFIIASNHRHAARQILGDITWRRGHEGDQTPRKRFRDILVEIHIGNKIQVHTDALEKSQLSDYSHGQYQQPYKTLNDTRVADSDSFRILMLYMDSTSLPNVWKHLREKEKCYLDQWSTSVQTANNNKITGDRGEYRTLGFHTLQITIKNPTFYQVYKSEIGGNRKAVSDHNISRVSYGQNTQKLKVTDPCNIALGLGKPLLLLLWYKVMITRQFNHCKLCPSTEKVTVTIPCKRSILDTVQKWC